MNFCEYWSKKRGRRRCEQLHTTGVWKCLSTILVWNRWKQFYPVEQWSERMSASQWNSSASIPRSTWDTWYVSIDLEMKICSCAALLEELLFYRIFFFGTHSFSSGGKDLVFDLNGGLFPSRQIILAASSGDFEENGGDPSIIWCEKFGKDFEY